MSSNLKGFIDPLDLGEEYERTKRSARLTCVSNGFTHDKLDNLQNDLTCLK